MIPNRFARRVPRARAQGERSRPRDGLIPLNLVSIRPLKDLVMARFPEDHLLRAVLLAERDFLSPAEFLAKLETWSVLLNRKA